MHIAGGLVTFNRLGLLRRAVDAALTQTRPADTLFVINNASTDGTADYLATITDPRVVPVNLHSNLGGAGGFAMAVELATRLGHDAIWVFDDDGIPAPGALAGLEEGMQRHRLDMAGSLVMAEDDDASLAFGLIPETPRYRGPSIWTVADAEAAAQDGVLMNMANPFNGTLLSLPALAEAGSIRPEMFIWGDEIELMRRLIRDGRRVGTVVAARHRHPRSKSATKPTPFGPVRVPAAGREIFYHRNMALNVTHHHGHKRAISQLLRTMAQHAWLGAFDQVWKIPRWWMDGARDRYHLSPSRDELTGAWSRERDRALTALAGR